MSHPLCLEFVMSDEPEVESEEGMRILRASIKKEDYLSTGSTLLNLACSGMPEYGLAKGLYFWMVGDSSSGKTFLMLTCIAEACRNPNWDGYDLIFDDVEGGALMDFEKFFGKKMAQRIKPPKKGSDGVPIYSDSAEDFYFGLDDKLKAVEAGKAKPFLYLLDSMDALTTKYEGEKFQEKKSAKKTGKKPTGDYGDGKAKINSTWIRTVVRRLRDTRCTLIVLSQTRDNVGGGLFDPKSTSAGGRALKFYATWQLWSSPGASLTKLVNGQKRQLGMTSRITIKKNRLTGKEWTVEVPIYHSYGIDDIGSCINFLVKEKAWSEEEGTLKAPIFDFSGKRDTLIRKIESERLHKDLIEEVTDVWRTIEEACQVARKPRYE